MRMQWIEMKKKKPTMLIGEVIAHQQIKFGYLYNNFVKNNVLEFDTWGIFENMISEF